MSVQDLGLPLKYIPTESEFVAALNEIESQQFDIHLSVVSDFHSFLKLASQEQAVRLLLIAMISSEEFAERAVKRLLELSALDIDLRYQNPHDTALTVLLWLTFYGNSGYVYMAADAVQRVPQTWNARKLARQILVPAPISSGNYSDSNHEKLHKNASSLPGIITVRAKHDRQRLSNWDLSKSRNAG